MKRIVIDLDNTLCRAQDGDYANAEPITPVIDTLRQYHNAGFEITVHTARNMRSFDGDLARITAHTLPLIIDWLARHNVPYDHVVVGKPWCGDDGFYVDDRAIRPSEFVNLTYAHIAAAIAG